MDLEVFCQSHGLSNRFENKNILLIHEEVRKKKKAIKSMGVSESCEESRESINLSEDRDLSLELFTGINI